MTIYIKIENDVVVDRVLFDGDMPSDWPDHAKFKKNETAQIGWIKQGANFVAPPDEVPSFTPPPPAPNMTGSAGFTMADGAITGVELGALVAGAYYEQGYVQVYFLETQTLPYLVFVQTDMPCRVEQYKEPGALELVFSDPLTGNPIDLGRIDLQILNVR